MNTFSIIPHLFFSKQGDNFLSTDLRSLPKISRKLSSIDRSSICLFSRVEKFAVSFFSLHTSFSFYFRNFPRAESLGGRFGGGSRSIWFIGGRRSLPRAEDCNFEAGGGAFRTAFRRHFRPTPRLLLLNVPSPPPPSARPSPLIAFIAPLSSDTFARKSFLIDNRRLATSVSGECFSPNCVSTIASSIPSLAGKFHVHDRKFVGYAGSWGWILSGSPTICGSIRVFSFAVLEIFGRENTRTRFNNNNKTNSFSRTTEKEDFLILC